MNGTLLTQVFHQDEKLSAFFVVIHIARTARGSSRSSMRRAICSSASAVVVRRLFVHHSRPPVSS